MKRPITWEKRVVDSNLTHIELAFDEYGKEHNQTLLFLHGFGESRYTWRFLVDDLSKKYHLVTLDLKGFGESPKPEDDDYSVYDQARIVGEFIENQKLKNITIVGRSFGGGISLVLALMQEQGIIKNRLDRLVLINSMSYEQKLPSMMRVLTYPIIGFLGIHLMGDKNIAKEAYNYAFNDDKLIPLSSVNHSAKMLSMPLAKYAYLQTVNNIIPDDIREMEKGYKDIKLPTLILWGKKDVSIPYKFGKRLHQDLPNSHLKIFKKVGHMPQEEVPQRVVEEINRFMVEYQ
ncbi:alpha/beta hydrolase [Sulfurovum sp. bin170]|uniref:alpha/beta fold hydrolase n=1 Tax=Sulfurovum sp. bin170 TaxID=2695268 RepID=UPI0013E04252|nr:alpha/beta hydrolase [Sulfurovum sp. bin170]